MPIERLSAEDALMLRGDELWPQDIGAVVLLDGGPLLDPDGALGIDVIREAIRSRLHLVPRLRQVLCVPRRGLGTPVWVDHPSLDLTEHVQVLPLPAPGGEPELLRTVEQLKRRRLDRSRPLWEMWFLTGLTQGRVALFVRMHHAIADGMAALTTIGALLDPTPDAPPPPVAPWTPAPPPTGRRLLADNLRRHGEGLVAGLARLARPCSMVRQVRRAWPALRELLAGEPGRQTSLHRLIGPDRTLAVVHGTLAQVKEIADHHDATVNDVLLTLTAGGLRALLRSRGEPVDGTLPIYVPVSLRRGRSGPAEGNLISQMVVPLPVGVADPGRRLRQIAAETVARKALTRTSLGSLFRGRIASALMMMAIKRQRVNVVSANVPGPEQPLYLAAARVLAVFPVLNLIGTVALAVGALSYAGTFTIAVTADRDAYPDVGVLVAGVREELRALGAMDVAPSGRTGDA